MTSGGRIDGTTAGDGAAPADRPARRHILTVVVEDYFQHSGFNRLIGPDRWRRFEGCVERNTGAALDLLDRHGIKATFFASGWVADKLPQVMREVSSRGHEVASKGYHHRALNEMAPEEFRDDLLRSREAIERACGTRVLGYRIPKGTFTLKDLWALDILAEEGFAYDSSIYPRLWCIAREPWRRFPHVHRWRDRELREFPLSSWGPAWLAIPGAGGNWFRQVPEGIAHGLVARWDRRHDAPFNLYFHVWELDPDLPRIEAVGRLTRIRQYRNLDRMRGLLDRLFATYRFESIADHLGMPRSIPLPGAPAPEPAPAPAAEAVSSPRTAAGLPPVTIVIPVFNEELAIPYLANTLAELREDLGRAYDLRFVFVDDASTDRTWESLHRHFAGAAGCDFARHGANRGVAAAILTGLRQARTEVVCSIDCDCTYDPRQLADMIPMLAEGVDMVTASPYHRLGRVVNVPAWRLSLSKGLSFLYRRVLHNRLATYTACFRVYRRSALAGIEVREGGFLGVVETLGRLDLGGSRVVECPAVLEVRMLGYSKMKILRTIAGHLRLLARLAVARWRGGPARATGGVT